MNFDLYVWQSPRDLDEQQASALVEAWQQAGGDPATSPFEPSTDIGWFHRELMQELPELDVVSDAVPNPSKRPSGSRPRTSHARVVAIRLPAGAAYEAFNEVAYREVRPGGLRCAHPQVRFPLQEMGAYADATFWPAGAIQAGVAGGIGAAVAIVAWAVSIPLLSGVLIIVGGFMAVMAIWTFIEQGRKALRAWQARRA